NGKWQMANSMVNCEWQTLNRKWQMANSEQVMANCELGMANGKWKTVNSTVQNLPFATLNQCFKYAVDTCH
ncbi:hypothetical protein PAXRUDRAFT_171764, partial [Paxillus rubicundulus Ve08.2h10]